MSERVVELEHKVQELEKELDRLRWVLYGLMRRTKSGRSKDTAK